MSVVLAEAADRILTVTVNRPDKLNALNAEVLDGLHAAFAAARENPDVGGRDPDGRGREGVRRGSGHLGVPGVHARSGARDVRARRARRRST